jgi:lysophospholipid acyltransferase (LPLAT)-like uncharacterized protein
VQALRRSCRVDRIADPRPALRNCRRPYVLALLHAHQFTALVAGDEPQLAAMLSRSRDGELLAPALRRVGVTPVRGSSRSGERDKGGRGALKALVEHLASGRPALLAVDGPSGPRGRVQLGIAELASRSGAAVVPVLPLASRRLRIRGSWDRLQIPLPFARIAVHFGAPLEQAGGESVEALRDRIEAALSELESRLDPYETQAARRSSRGAEEISR